MSGGILRPSGAGKTVQIRRYPVAVSVESLAICSKPLGVFSWEGRSGSLKRKSEYRPDEYGLHSTSLGELKSMISRLHPEESRGSCLPTISRSFCDATMRRGDGASYAATRE
jgi:hypothetical protein